MISLLIYGFMVYACDYLVMICNLHGGFPRLILVLAFPRHLLDNHGVLGFFHLLFCDWFSGSLWLWVELLVIGVIGWEKHYGICGKTFFELLVLEPWLEKHSRALSGLSY